MNGGWEPTAPLSALQARAQLYQQIRQFFDERAVLEVETPQLAHFGVTDLHIDCMPVAGYGYLQSSPEYHMKRLLAAGSGSIWQLCKSFRQGEAGRRHNPEFTLLEWYRVDFSLDELIAEVVALLQLALPSRTVCRRTFREAFRLVTGLDPLRSTVEQLAAHARRNGMELPELDHAGWVDWLMVSEIEPSFVPDELTVITDFPAWAAALAEITTDTQDDTVAKRFEVYSGGVELANGYQELRDASEQAARFAHDRALRQQAGKPLPEIDPWLLAAMTSGLPKVSGVALGIDRLLMVMQGARHIDEVMAFPWERA